MVRRTLNWKVLLITVVGGAAFGGVLVALHAWQLQRTASGLLVLAGQQVESGEWLKAAEYFDRFLRLRPDDVEARVQLALNYGRAARLREATSAQKQRAIELHYRATATGTNEHELELRRALAELLIETSQMVAADRQTSLLSSAEKEAQRILDSAGADDPQGLRLLALALFRQLAEGSLVGKKTEEVNLVKTVEHARGANPGNVELAMLVARLYRQYPQAVLAEYPGLTEPARHQRANDSIDQLVRDNPQFSDAYLARFAYRSSYNLPDALADLDTALRLSPSDPTIRLASAANAYERANQARQADSSGTAAGELLAQAKDHYEELLKQERKNHLPQYYLGLGDVLAAMNDLDEALKTWREGIGVFKPLTTQAAFHARIADACIEADRLGDAQEALKAIDDVLGGLGNSVRRDDRIRLTWAQDLRRASWHIKRLEFADAVPLLRTVIAQTKAESDSQPALQAWLKLGNVYGAIREWREAGVAYDQACSLQPSLHQARVASASAWLYAGRADMAIERADLAVKTAGSAEAWLVLAQAEFQQQLTRPPQDRLWTRFEQALDVLERNRDKSRLPAPWQVEFLRADYVIATDSAKGNAAATADAAAQLQRAEQAHGGQRTFWLDVCLAYQRLKRDADAERALKKFREAGGEPADVALAQSRLARLRGDDERAKAVLEEAVRTVPVKDRDKLRQEMLRGMLAAKDLKSARALLAEDHKRQPRNLAIVRRLADIDLELRDFSHVAAWEEKLRGEGVLGEQLARYYRAARLMQSTTGADAPELREALHELEQVVLAHPNWPEAATLKAIVEQRLGQIELAVADYERAVQLGERRLVVFEQLIGLLDQLRRPADVERYLARLQADLPLTQRLAELAANFEVRRDRPERALEIARRNAKERPSDAMAQLWLARLLLVTGERAEAERAFRQAATLAPSDSQTWSGLLAFHSQARDREGLAVLVRDLESNTALEAAQKNLLLGQAHAALGDVEAATRSFAQAADEGQNDVAAQLRVAQFFLQSDPERARRHLENALRLDPKSAAARRMLAIVDASQGNLEAAERLLTEGVGSGAASAEDSRLHAVLLLRQGGAANLERAAAVLEDVVARGGASQAVDHLLLARVYEQQSQAIDDPAAAEARLQWAEGHLNTLAERTDPDPAHLAALVQFLSRHQRSADATPWLAKLEDRVNSLSRIDANAIVLVIQTQVQHGSAARSEKWLQKLDQTDSNEFRRLAMRAHVAHSLNGDADLESLVEAPANRLLSEANTNEDKQQLCRSVGDLYMSVNRFSAAERWYRRPEADNERQFPAVATALARQGKLREAIELCERTALTDASARPALVLTKALVEAASIAVSVEYQRAEPLIAAALKKFDSDVNLLYSVALLRVVEGRTADSIELFRKVVRLNPRFVPALNNLAMMLAESPADQAEALRLIDQAIEVQGKEAGLLDTKGAILIYNGRSREAVPLLESSVRGSQADPRHHFHLAVAYRDQGKVEQAKQQLRTALDRKLVSLVLTATDLKLLAELRTALQL